MNNKGILVYFKGWGRAEPIRWMLSASAIEFEEKLITSAEDLLKAANEYLLFSQVPCLEIDGIEIVQTQAIIRYLARRFSLYGKSKKEIVMCDMIAESINDARLPLLYYPFKSALELNDHIEIMKKTLNKYCSIFEIILRKNNPSGAPNLTLVGDTMSYTDILLAEFLFGYESILPGSTKKWSLCTSLLEQVSNSKPLVKYLSSTKHHLVPIGQEKERYSQEIRKIMRETKEMQTA